MKSDVSIIDLSVDFRLDDKNDYENWYGFKHSNFEVNDEFQYGLTEFNRDKIKNVSILQTLAAMQLAS